jgi:type I restriction enzyme, S subunit
MSAESLPIHPDWKRRSLGDVADITLGGTPSTDVRGYWGGTIPWMSSGEVNKKRVFEADGRITEAGLAASNATLIDPPTVAVGLAGQGKTRGTVALVNIRVSTNQSIALIKGREGQLDTYYLFHNLDGRYDELRTRSAGGGRAGLSREILAAVPIGVPDLAEQSRIALVLDTVDEAIAKTEAVIAKLRQVRVGLLHDLLTRGLDPHGQLHDPIAHPEQFQPSPLGQVPKEWFIESVGELFEMQLGKMLSPRAKGGGESRPYVGNRHVLWERVDLTDLEFMDFSPHERAKFALRLGDLLVCEGGEVGRTALWRGELSECYFQKAIHRLRPKDDRIVPEYMLAFMKRAAELGSFVNLTSQTSIAHLTQEKLAILRVARPPRDEQVRMIDSWSAVQAEHDATEATLRKLLLLKSGLMTDLLTGRVRVPSEGCLNSKAP